jgi:hypothetical protein
MDCQRFLLFARIYVAFLVMIEKLSTILKPVSEMWRYAVTFTCVSQQIMRRFRAVKPRLHADVHNQRGMLQALMYD